MGIIAMTSSKTAWIGSLQWSYADGEVTVSMYTGKEDGVPSSAPSGAGFTASITVDGVTETFSYPQQEIEMLVGSVTVPVSGSTAVISGRVDAPSGVSMYGYPLTGSETVTLWEEPEEPEVNPSSITLGAASVQMGQKLSISIDREDTGCTHTLKYTFGGTTGSIAKDVENSYSWTVPDLVAKCPNALSGTCTVTCYTYYDGESVGSDSKTVTLIVPSSTVPSIDGGEVTLGKKSTVSCKRNSSGYTVKLEFLFGNSTVAIASGKLDSGNWTPGYDLAKQIPNLTYGTGTLKCTTMNGTAVVGTKTATVRVNVPNNSVTRPKFTLSGLTLTPVSSLKEDFTGLYIRGKTGIQAGFSASSDYSTVKSYSLTVGSQSASGNPAKITMLTGEGSLKVTAKVTDARGYSTSVSTTVTVLPYRQPNVIPCSGYTDVICERALSTGELSPKGTYLAIKAGKSFSSITVDGVNKNKCILRYRWKANGADSFSEWKTVLSSGSTENEKTLLVGNVVTSLQTSYLVEIQAKDTLGDSHTLTFQIMTEAISFVLYDGPDGAAFGKYPEEPHVVDIASHMKLLVRGEMEVTGEQWLSLGLNDGLSESTYSYGRAGSGCFYRVVNGNHVYIAFNCAFTYSGSAKTVNATKIPEKYRPPHWVISYCPLNGRCIAAVSVDTAGIIQVEYIQNPRDTADTATGNVSWLDGYLDYFI